MQQTQLKHRETNDKTQLHKLIQCSRNRRLACNIVLVPGSPKGCPLSLSTRLDRLLQVKHTLSILRPFFRDHPGEPVPEENFWTLWCKGRLTEADTPTIRLCATLSGLTSANLHHPPIFYRPDALPVILPTVSKH